MSHPELPPVVDSAQIASLKELGDDALLFELIELFVQDSATQLAALQGALATGDLKLLERTAHSLKSASANVGAQRFSKLCLEIEKRGRAADPSGMDELVARATSEHALACRALEALKS